MQINNLLNDKTISYRGYRFYLTEENNSYIFRSLEEFLVFITLSELNINFKYEPFFITWLDINTNVEHKYLPDFIVDNEILEIKTNLPLPEKEQFKYDCIQKVLDNTQYFFMLMTYKDICKKYNVHPLSKLQIVEKIKCLINDNKITKIQYHKGRYKPRLLMNIDVNYESNKIFEETKFKNKENQNEMG